LPTQVQVTCSFTLIVLLGGLKKSSPMDTLAFAAWLPSGLAHPQPTNKKKIAI
jgi:hypothetical protein